MKKALVTGIAGFVGSTLAEKLHYDHGVEVVGIDSITDYYDPSIKERNISKLEEDGVSISREDLAECEIDSLLDGVDVVFHQAGQPGVRPSWGQSFTAYTRANIDATQRLLEAVRKSESIEKVVYASSSSVYGNARKYPTTESDLPRPLSPYGVTKLAAEHLMSLYAENYGLPTVSLRYFTVYGPRQRPDMAFSKFIRSALEGSPIPVYGDGTQIRDFTYVDDIVSANILAATQSDVSPGSFFNVSGGSSVTVNETLDILQSLIDKPIEVKRTEKMAGDVFQTGGDWAAARKHLNWRPQVSIEEGLARQVEWTKKLCADTI